MFTMPTAGALAKRWQQLLSSAEGSLGVHDVCLQGSCIHGNTDTEVLIHYTIKDGHWKHCSEIAR